MECKEASALVEAYVDGELDLARHLGVEAHLTECAACARAAEALRASRSALRESLPRFAAPSQLTDRILSAFRAAGASDRPPTRVSQPAPVKWPLWNVLGFAASVVIAVAVGFTWGNARARGDLLLKEGIGDHIRSLQLSHLSDVASTDQHTVKPWFAGKLDFSPPVVDLAVAGYPLVGGRLDHMDGRPAAALIFHRRLHAINLFIWPSTLDTVSERQGGLDGYRAESWSQGGFNFMAVSEIPEADLRQFVEKYRAAVAN